MNNLFGNNVEEVGSLNKNLVLKTSGQIKIQFGKKFINLLDSNGNLNPSLFTIIKKVNSKDKISSDGFYYYNNSIIVCVSGVLLELASTSGSTYVSFLEEQITTGEQKQQALKNIGFIYDSLSDVKDYPTNGIIYVEQEKSLYVINNGNISKYEGNIPNPINTQIVITKDDNLEGSLVISGIGINNSIKFDNLKIYNNQNLDSVFSSKGTQIFSIDNKEIANINSEGLKVRGISSLTANDSKGFNIYQNNDNDFVMNIDIIKVRKSIQFKDSTLYSPEFGLDPNFKDKEENDENKYLKYPHYTKELYEKLQEDLKSDSENYKYLVLPYGIIKDLIQTYIKQNSSSISIGDRYWYVDNYLVDIAIDDYVTKYYNLSVKTKSDSNVIEGDWESYPKDKRTLLMQSAIIPCAEDGTFYATKYFKFEKIYDCKYTLTVNFQEDVNFKTYEFKEISSEEYDETNKDHYKIEGAFAELGLMFVNNTEQDISQIDTSVLASPYNVQFENDGTSLRLYEIVSEQRGEKYDSYKLSDFAGTTTVPGFTKVIPHLPFLKSIQTIGDFAGRGPTYRVNRGRTRPLNTNSSTGTGRYGMKEHSVSEATGHRLNSIFNRTLVQRYAEDREMFLKLITVDELNADGPASYPSGHASQTWAVAMLLAQVFNNNLENVKKYMRGAYIVGVERSIARFHWNSDIMYGRLFATMVMPIINANPSFDNPYNGFAGYFGLNPSILINVPSNSNYSDEFTSLIENFDMVDISNEQKSYLNAMYIDAIKIFDDYTSKISNEYAFLFTTIDVTDPVYYEIFPSGGVSIKYTDSLSKTVKFRGENTTYNVSNLTRKDIYISWFIGLCLSELYANSGDDINNQTKIMAKAYSLGGGRELDLYNEYKIDYDPMILRYAASAIYMILRGKFSKSALRDLRIGNSADFDANDEWLGFTGSNFSDSYTLGYCIDTYKIFPNAPGPYNELYGSNASEIKSSKPYEDKSVGSDIELSGHQRKEQFVTSAEVSSSSNSGSGGSGGGSSSDGSHPCHGTISKLTIKNESGYDWTGEYQLSRYLILYIVNGAGSGHVSISIPLYNDSTHSQLVEPISSSDKNQKCRFIDSFELSNGSSVQFTNVYFDVNSDDSNDYNEISNSGVLFEEATHKMYGQTPSDGLGVNNLADIPRNSSKFKITVTNDDSSNSNKFKGKSGSSYTVKIEVK